MRHAQCQTAATSGWQGWACLSIDCWTHIGFSQKWAKIYFQELPCATVFCLSLKQNDKWVFFCLAQCRLLHPLKLTALGAMGANCSTGCLNVSRDGASTSFQRFSLNSRKISLSEWPDTGCPERLWKLHFWRYSKFAEKCHVKSIYFALLCRPMLSVIYRVQIVSSLFFFWYWGVVLNS